MILEALLSLLVIPLFALLVAHMTHDVHKTQRIREAYEIQHQKTRTPRSCTKESASFIRCHNGTGETISIYSGE